MAAGFVAGFLLGLLLLAAAEAAALLWVLRRLRRRHEASAAAPQPDAVEELPGERPFPYEKKGSLWILEPEKLPKVSSERLSSGGLKETKDKKSIVEVFPAKKMAKLKGHLLSLSGPDVPDTAIELSKCTVVAVSASSMPSRKWTKRYPIKLESQEHEIYNGSKVCFLYAETSWEKESWCKALRLAATADKEKLNWHAQLSKEFSNYISSLNSEYPCFLKPTVLSAEDHEVMDSETKTDGSSKVRLFLKKLAKKASTKVPAEGKTGAASSTQGEKKILDKIRSYQGAPFIEAFIGSQEDKSSNSSSQDTAKPSAPTAPSSHAGQLPAFPDVNVDDKAVDEGTLCWNLLSSRLFFDAKMNDEINKFIKARIQRTLSSMRTPAYVGEITLTDFSIGELPPYVHAMRVLPLDLNELWAFEVDFEYSGGILLHIETRLEVEEPELQKDLMKTNFGTDSNGEVDSELLDSIEQYGNQFRGSPNSDSSVEEKEEADASQSKSTGWISRLKNMLHSIADHVSQVPLSLAIKITSVRGVLRIHLKPPPSDQLWFGFTSMPELEWDLESSVGDRKITNNRIASLIGNRIKASLRDSLVLPNCESIPMPWMLAEKDDWAPLKDGPYIWLNHELTETRSHVAAAVPTHPEEAAGAKADTSTKNAAPSSRDSSAKSEESLRSIDESAEDPVAESSHAQSRLAPASETSTSPSHPDAASELRKPLLSMEDTSERRAGSPLYTSLRAIRPAGQQLQQAALASVGEDVKQKSGRRSRMMDLGKKMGDKLEEKRRQVEEKGRTIVEKMRENARTNSMERTAS
ncbi:uncharacterized protein LOC124691006 [Lolium rigidum]|uniref:uncharacterized protein LOC124691006 n=1 Tax=Lolium rigidum TaxID=89674 RepID=UPI001F5E1054|nr:uncharacterized protein LOC124691006 [Lolium rigidum]